MEAEYTKLGAGKTALVVDDSKAMLMRATLMLHKLGFRAVTLTEPFEALEVPAREKVDLILLDVEMPGLDGYALCQLLRELPECDGTPILFLSARNVVAEQQEGCAADGHTYIPKSCDQDEFARVIRRALRRGEGGS